MCKNLDKSLKCAKKSFKLYTHHINHYCLNYREKQNEINCIWKSYSITNDDAKIIVKNAVLHFSLSYHLSI